MGRVRSLSGGVGIGSFPLCHFGLGFLDSGAFRVVGAVIVCVAVGAVDMGAWEIGGGKAFAFVAVFVVFVFGTCRPAFPAPGINSVAVLRVVSDLPASFALGELGDILPKFDADSGSVHVEWFRYESWDDGGGFVYE